jgi:hypothetical protein
METYRRRADYGSGEIERETEELIERTEAFLDVTSAIVAGRDDADQSDGSGS